MQEFERLNETIGNLADAATKAAIAMCEAAIAVISTVDIDGFCKKCNGLIEACCGHPEWVHRAKYSKKKRIRKKYRDRIMRQYRRAENV